MMSNIVKNVFHFMCQAICGENEWLTSKSKFTAFYFFCLLVLLYIMLAVFHAPASMIWWNKDI